MNKAVCGTKESATGKGQLEEWNKIVLYPTLEVYTPQDIYNSDETALFYKALPHRTYCKVGEKPAGSAKHKDRLTLLIITNMDGSDHRKLFVVGKAKTPHCLQKKYKMQVKDMAVDWYASKNAWMTGDIHNKIMCKFNNQMRAAGHNVLYVCDNTSSHQNKKYTNIKFLMLPPNYTLSHFSEKHGQFCPRVTIFEFFLKLNPMKIKLVKIASKYKMNKNVFNDTQYVGLQEYLALYKIFLKKF